jgi:hypothetical protein
LAPSWTSGTNAGTPVMPVVNAAPVVHAGSVAVWPFVYATPRRTVTLVIV